MLKVDLAKAFQGSATRIARASCSRLVIYREALAAPIPSRTVTGESRVELRGAAIDIGRIELETMQELPGLMVCLATSILQQGGAPKEKRIKPSNDER
jgi:hypothetical protein